MLIEVEIQRLFTGHSPQVSAARGKNSELRGSRGLNSSLNRVVIRLPNEVTAMRSKVLELSTSDRGYVRRTRRSSIATDSVILNRQLSIPLSILIVGGFTVKLGVVQNKSRHVLDSRKHFAENNIHCR